MVVAGLSLGGHVTLRYASEPGDARVRAVAAVSAPLDLAAGADAIDARGLALHRHYLLRGLRPHGARAHRAGLLAAGEERLRRVRTLREWDTLTVAPRFGFAGAPDYYDRASVAPRLAALRCPALLLASGADPMVPPQAIAPALAGSSGALEVRWAPRGGHLAFPQSLDLGLGGERGWAGQVLAWLNEHCGGSG